MITANTKAQLQIRTFKEKQSKTKKTVFEHPILLDCHGKQWNNTDIKRRLCSLTSIILLLVSLYQLPFLIGTFYFFFTLLAIGILSCHIYRLCCKSHNKNMQIKRVRINCLTSHSTNANCT